MQHHKEIELSGLTIDSFFEDAKDGMLLAGADGRILRVNAALARLLGYRSIELAGQSISTLFKTAEGSLPNNELPEGEIFARTKSGSDIELTALVLRRLNNHDGCFIILRKSRAQPGKELSRMISMASHEFRSPLSRIQLSACLIERYHSRLDEARLLDHLSRIKGAVRDMTHTLNDFLSVGRLYEGTVPVDKQCIILHDFVSNILSELRPLLKQGQRFRRGRGNPSFQVTTDPSLLRHCLCNLLSNAIKYSAEGTVIYIHTGKHNNRWTVRITDHGIGIPAAEQRHLFQPFFRASNTRDIEGTGLGLHIVQRYVQLMGGHLTYRSQEGKATYFTIDFPVIDEDHRTC